MELCPIQEAAQAPCFPGSLASQLPVSVGKPGKSTESSGPRPCFSLGSVATPPSSTLGGCVGPQRSLWAPVGSKWEGPAGEGPPALLPVLQFPPRPFLGALRIKPGFGNINFSPQRLQHETLPLFTAIHYSLGKPGGFFFSIQRDSPAESFLSRGSHC